MANPLEIKAQSKYRDDENKSKLIPIIGGGAFLVAGLLQRPDEKWIVDPNSSYTNNNGQRGYWRNEKIYESAPRSAAIVTGVLLIGVGIVIKF